MATYGKQYRYNPPRRKKQRYALVERVIDFTNNLPETAGSIDGRVANKGSAITTAWAADDVLQVMAIRAGQTILDVELEILVASADSGDRILVGYGDSLSQWGEYILTRAGAEDNATTGIRNSAGRHQSGPVYFGTPDTLDIVIKKAVIQGKIRLIVHLLEDDR